jgi:hypothetical protein
MTKPSATVDFASLVVRIHRYVLKLPSMHKMLNVCLEATKFARTSKVPNFFKPAY